MLFLLMACAGTKPSETTYTDEGTACLDAPTADAEGTVQVDPSLCLSSSCDELVSGTCTATLDGTTITVTSTFVVASTGEETCTADCGMPTATCTVGPLPAGDYTLIYGDTQQTVPVPIANGCDPLTM